MKLLLLFATILSISLYVEAHLEQQVPHPKRKPGACYHEVLGHMVKSQKLTIPRACTQATCHENGTILLISCHGVSASVGTSPPCKVVEGDLSRPYPDCCPTVKC